MMKCASEGCENDATGFGNYCEKHKKKYGGKETRWEDKSQYGDVNGKIREKRQPDPSNDDKESN